MTAGTLLNDVPPPVDTTPDSLKWKMPGMQGKGEGIDNSTDKHVSQSTISEVFRTLRFVFYAGDVCKITAHEILFGSGVRKRNVSHSPTPELELPHPKENLTRNLFTYS